MSIRRRTDPVYLQFIWSVIESNPQSTDFDSILAAIQSNFDQKCTSHKLKLELSNSISDGCVHFDGNNYILPADFLMTPKDHSDWYCFECHLPGLVVSCPSCYRVYHSDCLPAALETHWSCRLHSEDPTLGTNQEPDRRGPPDFPCPVCNRLNRAMSAPAPLSSSDLRKVFQVTLDCIRHRVGWRTMSAVGYVNESRRNDYLLLEQMNTLTIGLKLREKPTSPNGYPTRTAFLVDLDNLVHNCSIIYGSKHSFCNTARQIRSQLKRSMRESAYCVDCYLRSHHASHSVRMTAPCRQPHRLLWFQHNGWSFRPCKMLYESPEGYEVICFGGRHEREFVPRQRAMDMTFTATDLGLRMTPSLKKALDEAEEYKANQSAHDRHLPICETPSSLSSTTTTSERKIKRFRTNNEIDNSAVVVKQHGSGRRDRKRKSCTLGSTFSSTIESSSSISAPSSVVSTKRSKRVPVQQAITAASQNGKSINSDSSLDSFDSDVESSNATVRDKGSSKSRWRVDSVMVERSDEMSERSDLLKRTTIHQQQVSPLDANLTTMTHHPAQRQPPSGLPVPNGLQSYMISQPSVKPVIRIKPLPRLEDCHQQQPVSPDNHKLQQQHLLDEAEWKAETVSSGVSSSGCATIPATASLDELHSSPSRSSSTNKTSSRPRKYRHTHQHNLKKTNRPDRTFVRDSPKIPRNHLSEPNTSCHHRALSPSPLSSLSDSDSSSSVSSSSSSSSCSSRSQSPSSSDLSSTTSTSVSSISSAKMSLNLRFSLSTSTAGQAAESAFPPHRHGGRLINTDSSLPVPSTTTTKLLVRRVESSASNVHSHSKQSSHDGGGSEHSAVAVQRLKETDRVSPQATGGKKKASKKKGDKFVHNRPSKSMETSAHTTVTISTADKLGNTAASTNALSDCLKPNNNNNLDGGLITTNLRNKIEKITLSNSTSWSSLTKLSSNSAFVSAATGAGSRTPVLATTTGVVADVVHSSGGNSSNNASATATPSSSSSSSCYSSVSPAALSITSGLGSSVSDPKSVDASPAEVTSFLGGNTSFIYSNGCGGGIQSTAIVQSSEEHIHRIYADKLVTLTVERDQAREKLVRRDAQINRMRQEHEAEIKRIKQLTWCQVCLEEALYHCCPGTAYCSEACQLQHWKDQHNRVCRRRESQQTVQQ